MPICSGVGKVTGWGGEKVGLLELTSSHQPKGWEGKHLGQKADSIVSDEREKISQTSLGQRQVETHQHEKPTLPPLSVGLRFAKATLPNPFPLQGFCRYHSDVAPGEPNWHETATAPPTRTSKDFGVL